MDQLKGKDLERLVVELSSEYKRRKLAHITRCGVQAVRMKEDWQVIQSLPDFEGLLRDGRQLIFDCKVCSQASFDLTKYRSETKGARARQLRHLLDRSEFGAICFFLLHWNQRTGKTFTQEAATFVFPVIEGSDFWESFRSGETRNINRKDCETYGDRVRWQSSERGRKERPDFVATILEERWK
ncbi:MAG: Holliday junction resolvase RecU [Planctomyces sp.]|nr:Holliday junction resolvase RecU [Planctomyces sp.]